MKKIKWKTKAGAFEAKESARAYNIKLPQFTKRREFDIDKLHLHDGSEENHSLIIGRNFCQNIGLDILSSTQQFQWRENLVSMMPVGHWKDKKNSFKKRTGSMNESQIDEGEEEFGTIKVSENKHKKIDFDEELAK